eukprot:6593252-Pyramimonas_sp.AAC.1
MHRSPKLLLSSGRWPRVSPVLGRLWSSPDMSRNWRPRGCSSSRGSTCCCVVVVVPGVLGVVVVVFVIGAVAV